jgi:hypothetical protein
MRVAGQAEAIWAQRPGGVLRLANDFDVRIRAERGDDALAEQRMIVSHDDADRFDRLGHTSAGDYLSR